MNDFINILCHEDNSWVISAPKRAGRPDQVHGDSISCPFCVLNKEEKILFETKASGGQVYGVRVISNKYPFAKKHEVVILSSDHSKSFDLLADEQIGQVIECYVQRFNTHLACGSVLIFHNHGVSSGESIFHPHSQIAVVSRDVRLDIPVISSKDFNNEDYFLEDDNFRILTPYASQWPDEVWIVPERRKRIFGQIDEDEKKSLSAILGRLIRLFDLRHGKSFSYNFYIYPYVDWYLRIIPRLKVVGMFELATKVFVNTEDPKQTMNFIKKYWKDDGSIQKEHMALYRRGV